MKADVSRLKISMARACMNTADIAKSANMPLPTVRNVIAGRNVKPATLGKVAKAIGVDVSEVIAPEEYDSQQRGV